MLKGLHFICNLLSENNISYYNFLSMKNGSDDEESVNMTILKFEPLL